MSTVYSDVHALASDTVVELFILHLQYSSCSSCTALDQPRHSDVKLSIGAENSSQRIITV